MAEVETHVVTGAFGFSGKYIASRLLEEGRGVRTLTASLSRENPFKGKVEAQPFHFDDQPALIKAMEGASVLYNTYWVRFNHKTFSHAAAVQNTLALFHAAKSTGVRRIVHVSITNPSEDSPFEYFRGKAHLESALKSTHLSYAILRPAVLFGHHDILINNIAWILRKFPLFGVFGDGLYRLQPIHVDDFASLAISLGQETANITIDAIGPETFTYRALVQEIALLIRRPRPIISIPPTLAYLIGRLAGLAVHDVVITRDEIAALMANLLCTNSPPAGPTKLTDFARQHSDTLGLHYNSELARRHSPRQTPASPPLAPNSSVQ